MDDDYLIFILNNCTLRGLINLSKTCKRFYALISKLPRYKKGIKELEELYTSGILKITEDEKFLMALWKKNYSSFVLESINFRFHSITDLTFYPMHIITNEVLTFIGCYCKNLDILSLLE